MRFIADSMLKKLCRWLRILGVECEYIEPTVEDDQVIRKAMKEKSVLLTRDKKLFLKARDYARVFLIETSDLIEQLALTAKKFRISLRNFPATTNCPQCNAKLKQVGRKTVENKVFKQVLKRHRVFWLCRGCGKVFWKGSHWKKIRKTAAEVKKKLRKLSY